MEDVAKVVLAIEEHAIAEEVMHFLDRTGRVRVVATAGDRRQLAEAVRQLEPDGVVASPTLLRSSAALRGSAVLAVDTGESIRALRSAVGVGARGFFVWPSEREQLASASARLRGVDASGRSTVGRTIAVHSARGGSGVTFLATHLAAAAATAGRRTILLDLDLPFGGVLDVVAGRGDDGRDASADERSNGDAPSSPDGPWRHDAGFSVVPAWRDTSHASDAADAGSMLDALAGSADVLVADVARGAGPRAEQVLSRADVVVSVLTLDVASFRATKRVVSAYGLDGRHAVVVNRARRSEVSPRDVERVFGMAPLAVIPNDPAVAAAQDRGRLMPSRSRVGRAVGRLAARLVEGV